MQLSIQTVQILKSLIANQNVPASLPPDELVERAMILANTRRVLDATDEARESGGELILSEESTKLLCDLLDPVINNIRAQLKSVEGAKGELKPSRQVRRAEERKAKEA